MSFLFALSLLWVGVPEPDPIAEHLEQVVFDQIADPVDRWRPLVSRHFPADEVETAMCILRHESRGNPEADNPRSTASGLFQVLASLWGPHYGVTVSQLYDPEINVRIARDIWDNYGWGAWSPYKRGNCRGL